MFVFYVYLYCSSFRYVCLAGAAELIDVSLLFWCFCKARGLPRCCSVEELGLLFIIIITIKVDQVINCNPD